MIGKYARINGKIGKIIEFDDSSSTIRFKLTLGGISWEERAKIETCEVIEDSGDFESWIDAVLEEFLDVTEWVSDDLQELPAVDKAFCWLAIADLMKALSLTIRSQLSESGLKP